MSSESSLRFVVGLGNPQRKYGGTRHNVGFMVLAELRRRWDLGRAKRKFHARCWSGRIGPGEVMLLAPQTYMNRSGLSVAEVVAFHKASPSEVLVVMDDMNLPAGRLRARPGGSAGGHKGLDDVLSAVGTEQVPRLRIGIGAPPPGADAIAYVLERFEASQRTVMEQAIRRAADAVEDWTAKGIAYVMNQYNQDTQATNRNQDGNNE